MLTAAAQAPTTATGGPGDTAKDSTQKKPFSPTSGTNGINSANSNSSANTKDVVKDNSDDEDNMWDVDVGELIIDLDADIERDGGSTGRQTTPQRNNDSKNTSTTTATQRLSNNGKSNANHHSQSHQKSGSSKNPFPNLTEAVMPGRISSSGSTMSNGGSGSGPVTTTASSSVSSTHHHASKPNFSSSSTSGGVQADPGTASLKMKIKRKSIGGKSSETKHEIVPNNETTTTTGTSNNASVTSPYAFERNSNSPKSLTSSSVINNNSEDAKDKNEKSNNQKHHLSSKNKSGGSSHHHKPKHHEHHRERRHSSSAATENHNNDDNVTPRLISERSETSNIHKRDNISEKTETGTQTSIGTMTEADCLGPCEPGTSIHLSGIVWQELLEGGLLTLNVTWREKSYVGTLLDASRHDWAPPRLCDSPSSDIDSKSLKMTRGKRTRSNLGLSEPTTSKLRSGKGRRTANSGFVPPSPAKSDSSANGASSLKKKARPLELEISQTGEEESKRSKLLTSEININTSSPNLLECPESGCLKKFKNLEGLRYHQSHSHPNSFSDINSDQEEMQDEGKNLDNEDSSQEAQPIENGFKPIVEEKEVRPNSPAYSDISDEEEAVPDKSESSEIKSPEEKPTLPIAENSGATLMDLQNFANPPFETEKKDVKLSEARDSPSKVVPPLLTKPEEGVKPTMETQGPPPPTNGNYYYNRSFMPSFPPMNPYDYAMRGSAAAAAGLMGGPFGHPAAAMLHQQMRFPGMDPTTAGYPIRQPLPPQPPTSVASGKPPGASSSVSFAQGQKQSSALSPRDHPPRAGPPLPAPPHLGAQQPPPGSLPRPHPSIHPNSHVGYPMFDPYSAMMVNHGSNPFGPK